MVTSCLRFLHCAPRKRHPRRKFSGSTSKYTSLLWKYTPFICETHFNYRQGYKEDKRVPKQQAGKTCEFNTDTRKAALIFLPSACVENYSRFYTSSRAPVQWKTVFWRVVKWEFYKSIMWQLRVPREDWVCLFVERCFADPSRFCLTSSAPSTLLPWNVFSLCSFLWTKIDQPTVETLWRIYPPVRRRQFSIQEKRVKNVGPVQQ